MKTHLNDTIKSIYHSIKAHPKRYKQISKDNRTRSIRYIKDIYATNYNTAIDVYNYIKENQ